MQVREKVLNVRGRPTEHFVESDVPLTSATCTNLQSQAAHLGCLTLNPVSLMRLKTHITLAALPHNDTADSRGGHAGLGAGLFCKEVQNSFQRDLLSNLNTQRII